MRCTPIRHLRLYIAALALLTPATCAAQGIAGLADHIFDFIAKDIFTVMGGIVLMFILYYGGRMIMESQNDDTIATAKKSFMNALMGFGILAATFPILYVFTTGDENLPINIAPILPEINNVIQYITFVARGIFILLLTYNGMRILSANGDEGTVESARKNILINIVGIIIMAVADAIVLAIYGNAPGVIAIEIAGIVAFLVAMIGAISVIALILAGILLIVSVDEGLKDKAKSIVTGTIWSIVICLASYIIITTFAFDLT